MILLLLKLKESAEENKEYSPEVTNGVKSKIFSPGGANFMDNSLLGMVPGAMHIREKEGISLI